MGGSCVVRGCPNFSTPCRNISYFRFPNASKFPQLHQAWLNAIKPIFTPSNNGWVCELHFTEDDYDETYKMKKLLMPNYYFRCMLKPDAVPKLHLPEGVKDDCLKKREILKELLGESYVRWKESTPPTLGVVKTPKKTSPSVKKRFNFTTDYILKKPLKPLPEALQRLLPTILSKRIHGGPIGTCITTKNTPRLSKQFICNETIPKTQFYTCSHCKFSTLLQVHLLEHVRTAHQPIKSSDCFHLPMKISRFKEPQKYSCKTCDFFSFSKLVLLRHCYWRSDCRLLTKDEKKWFECEHCRCEGEKTKREMRKVHKIGSLCIINKK